MGTGKMGEKGDMLLFQRKFGGHNSDFGFPISPCLTLDPFGVPVPSKEPFPQGPSAGPATGLNAVQSLKSKVQSQRHAGLPLALRSPEPVEGATRFNGRLEAARSPDLAVCRTRGPRGLSSPRA